MVTRVAVIALAKTFVFQVARSSGVGEGVRAEKGALIRKSKAISEILLRLH